MKKAIKNLLSVILILATFASVLSLCGFAETAEEAETIDYWTN